MGEWGVRLTIIIVIIIRRVRVVVARRVSDGLGNIIIIHRVRVVVKGRVSAFVRKTATGKGVLLRETGTGFHLIIL